MVRRWSYLGITPSNYKAEGVLSAHKFKVFRRNTKFKRFNRGIIDFVRRKNVKRRRIMNFLTLSYLTSDWAKFYLNNKSVTRYAQGLYMFNTTWDTLASNVTIRLAKKHSYLAGFYLSSIPSKRALSTINYLNNFNINLATKNYNNNTLISVNNYQSVDPIIQIGASTLIESNFKLYIRNKSHLAYPSLSTLSLNSTLSSVMAYRSTLILLTLFSTNFINIWN